MNRDEFTSLPVATALGLLFDASVNGYSLDKIEAPKPAQSPKYDTRIRVKGGFSYASECDLSQIVYFHNRAQQPPMNESYADKQEKEAKALGFFLRWRNENPTERWRGERYGQGVVTAEAPSSRPRVLPWDEKPKADTDRAPAAGYDDGADGELPF